MNEYDIAIRETMEMTVTVEAASREEDRRMVALAEHRAEALAVHGLDVYVSDGAVG